MSSVPITNGGEFSTVPVVGCSEPRSNRRPSAVCDENSPRAEANAPQYNFNTDSAGSVASNADLPPEVLDTETIPRHRIPEVRNQQGISVRSMARRMGIDIRSYRRMEDPSRDLTLSELAQVQKALDVPIGDLLVDRDDLSRPVQERAKLIKAMKTAVAIKETKSSTRVHRLAEMLCDQLTDVMPELRDVGGWPQYGARRGTSALGKALAQPIDTSSLGLDG